MFKRPWIILRRQLNGKYTAVSLSAEPAAFDPLKPLKSLHWPNGVYVYLDRPAQVALATCSDDGADLFLANGGFSDKQFEMLSYLSNSRILADSRPYLTPPQA